MNSITSRLAVLAVGLAGMAAAQTVEARSARIVVRLDHRLHRSIDWAGAPSGTILSSDPAVQDGLEVAGLECTAFELDPARTVQRRITSADFGPALETIVFGTYSDTDRKLAIERKLILLLPDRFPDVVLTQSTYRNTAQQSIHLDAVFSQRVSLDRRIAEPKEHSFAFASFQGGAYKWGNEYAVIRLETGFSQSNFQGVDDVRGAEGVGGGIPFIDIWSPLMGVAIAHLESSPQWVSLPVEVTKDGKVTAAITETPLSKFKQQEWLAPGQSFTTLLSAMILHHLDYYDALHTYGELLRARGVPIPRTSPASAYQPYWKSWGYRRDFSLQQFLEKLPELRSMGITMANLDAGWENNVGDWDPIEARGKFLHGDTDMVRFVREVHDRGFRIGIWWYPLGVTPQSALAKQRPDLLVQGENGEYALDPDGLYQLCPAYGPALERIRGLVKRIVSGWGFDGVYSDFQGLSAVPPCFNAVHHHKSPLDSFQSLPKVFETISRTLHELKPDPYNEVCICSLPHSPYNMPFYDIANASDPLTPWQVRSRIKLEKAIRGGTFAVGDCYQVPIDEWTGSSVPESFESVVGTGGQLTTFYRNLDDRQKALWNRWFHEYNELGLSRAEYVNLYDLAFDKPEGHAVRKGRETYYGFFADYWPQTKPIELRGLDRNTKYEVYDYGNRVALGQISGADPHINHGFKDSLLLRVRPVDQTTVAR